MTLLEEKNRLITFHEEGQCTCKSLTECLETFADALLEEACKAVCQLCAVGTPLSHEEDLKDTTHNIGTVENPDYRQCRASAIRSGKGK